MNSQPSMRKYNRMKNAATNLHVTDVNINVHWHQRWQSVCGGQTQCPSYGSQPRHVREGASDTRHGMREVPGRFHPSIYDDTSGILDVPSAILDVACPIHRDIVVGPLLDNRAPFHTLSAATPASVDKPTSTPQTVEFSSF